MGLVIFVVLWSLVTSTQRTSGGTFAALLLLYFPGRFVLEVFKETPTLAERLPLTVGQALSVPFIVLGLRIAWVSAKRGATHAEGVR